MAAARMDSLTKCVNKGRFLETLNEAMDSDSDTLSLLFIDIDHFKVCRNRKERRGRMCGWTDDIVSRW